MTIETRNEPADIVSSGVSIPISRNAAGDLVQVGEGPQAQPGQDSAAVQRDPEGRPGTPAPRRRPTRPNLQGLTKPHRGLVKTGMAGKRSTAAATEARVIEVARRLSSSPRSEIVAYCRTKWGASPRTADDYIARARAGLAESFRADLDAEAGIAKQRLERLLYAAEKDKDWHAAISAQRELIKLMGMVEPDHGDLNITVRIGGNADKC
jgi:hypothetical protein